MRNTPRNRARSAGEPTYVGSPCKVHGEAHRYVSTGHCLKCSSERGARRYAERGGEMRAYNKQWCKANPGRVIANVRKFQLKQQTPPWANIRAMQAFYAGAAELSKSTGIRHDVDHILPVRGERVSGLHVENNLQIITRDDNRRKGNRVDFRQVNKHRRRKSP